MDPAQLLTMGPADLPGVGVWTAKTVVFSLRPIQYIDQLFLGGVVTQTVDRFCSSYNVDCNEVFEFLLYHKMVYT